VGENPFTLKKTVGNSKKRYKKNTADLLYTAFHVRSRVSRLEGLAGGREGLEGRQQREEEAGTR